ncbi:MAG: branched-chain amino acid ABC transporter permease [Spirochaetaceae bacterium]|nr:branched-chain amino acid ABC transporter permease [Spirochaetaceae bacterium]MDT8298959.1 branched-chain amino acid ABC transporter permease [Spirochaetaceae bacterium]
MKKRMPVAGGAIALVLLVLLFVWKPTVIIYGMQRAGLYAAVAIPMGLVLGIVHIVNLAHGEFMMVSSYLTYFLATLLGLDPLLALIPATLILFVMGLIIFKLTISHTLKAPELNQLILTFGIAIVLVQAVNLIATSQPRKLSLDYVTASVQVGELHFGTYDFVFVLLAVAILLGLQWFLKRTRAGRAAVAVGQNPRGAQLVGINVNRTYMLVFGIATALVGVVGGFFLTKQSIFPGVGGSFTMKSFALVAMAGIGNLPTILFAALGLGIAEAFISSFQGYAGWSHIVFFALIVGVILVRSYVGARR